MAETLVTNSSSRQAGAPRARKSTHDRSQKHESYREQQLSRLVAGELGLTAQNNPNWRTRPSSKSPQTSSESLPETKRLRRHQGSPNHSRGRQKSSHTVEMSYGLPQDIIQRPALSTSGACFEHLDHPKEIGFYHVYKQIDLGHFGFGNGPLRLFEIGLPYNASSHSLARLERLRRHPASRIKTPEANKGPQASVEGQENKPPKGHDTGTSNPFSGAPSLSPNLSDTRQASNGIQEDFDFAFQKMLQKLSRTATTLQKVNEKPKPQEPHPTSSCGLRYPVAFTGRRSNTLSDPHQGWMSKKQQSHQKEDTTDSGVCVEECANSNSKSLNPKAREFLTKADLMSLKSKEHSLDSSGSSDDPPQSGLTNGLAPIRIEKPSNFSSNDSEAMEAKASTVSGTIEAGQTHPPDPKSSLRHLADPLSKALPSNVPPAIAYGAVSPFLLNQLFSGGGFVPLGGDALTGQYLAPPPGLTTLPALAAQQMQPIAGNMLTFPQPPLMNTVFPAMTARSVDPYAMRPGCAMPGFGPLATRPPPVPKPRRPDPRDQQAYEAWIEWRKANEPGYALECKLRQQRRAQRKLTDQSKAKSVRGIEASSSA